MAFWAQMLALGAAVGFLSAALGIGGGVLMVPAFLQFIDGIDPHTAKGTSLFIIVFVAAVNVWRLNRGVSPDGLWTLAALIAVGSMGGSALGVWVTSLMSRKAVLWFFVAVMTAGGIRTLLIEPRLVDAVRTDGRTASSILIGLATGFAAGATGIGGGLVMVPLVLITRLAPNRRVVALSNMVMVPTCLVGAFGHAIASRATDLPYTLGQISLGLAPAVFVGTQVGAPLGTWVNARLTLRRRKFVMGIVLFVVAVQMIYRAVRM